MAFYHSSQRTENHCDSCREGIYSPELACEAPHCAHDTICEGCAFTCADCSREFCGEHIVDLADQDDRLGTHFSVYLCEPCHHDRKEEWKYPAPEAA